MSDRGTILLSASLLARRWQDPAVNWVLAFLEEGVEREAVRDAIAARLGGRYRLKILTLDEVIAYLAGRIDEAYAFTRAIQLLVIIVTIAGIFDLLIASIVERRRELAVLRLIGAAPATLRRAVILESGAIGALGSLLGIGIGIVTARIWVDVHYRHLIGYYLEHHFAAGSAAWYVILVMLTTVAAGYGAARYASRRPVLDGIRAP
jgi:putative ABC transport system permease protein